MPNCLFISPFLPPTHTHTCSNTTLSKLHKSRSRHVWKPNFSPTRPSKFSLPWKCRVSEHSPTSNAGTGGNIGQLELPYTIIAPTAWDYTPFSLAVRKSFQESQTYLDKVRACVVKYTPAVKRFRDCSVKLSERSHFFSRSKEKPQCLRVVYMLCLILLSLCSSPEQH